MKFIQKYRLFENTAEAATLLVNPTSNMRDNYNKILKSINIVCAAYNSNSNKALLKEITMVESNLGTSIGTVRINGNGGRGPWQIDEISFNDIKARGNKEYSNLFTKFKNYTGVDLHLCEWNDCNQFLIGCAFAKLVLRVKGIKDDILSRVDRANAWKKYYNTTSGKGTPQKYWTTIQNCNKALNIKDEFLGKTYDQVVKNEEEMLASPDTSVYKPDLSAKIDSTYVDRKNPFTN